MEPVIVAAGSNLGDRHQNLRQAGLFLESISERPVQKSSVWESEPVGPSKFTFLNSAARLSTSLKPADLLKTMKDFEQKAGRKKSGRRWGPRILDLDIIAYGDLVIRKENLIIPHPEYSRRLFVLLPMMEIAETWIDPVSGRSVEEHLNSAPDLDIKKTNLTW